MKKLLFLTLTVTYGLQAITPYQSMNKAEKMLQEIEPVAIPLGQESQTQVNYLGLVGAATGAVLGFGACFILPTHMRLQQQTEVTENLNPLTTGIATSIATAVAGCASYLYAKSCTPEKIEETKTNNLIYDHNSAVKAFYGVNLSVHERNQLNRLPFGNPAIDDDRLQVYQGVSVATSNTPITERVTYLKNIATNLHQEKYACTQLTATRIAQLRASSLVADADQIARTIEEQKEYIQTMNAILPQQAIKNWCAYVEKKTPEYTTEKMQIDYATRYKQFANDEKNIKWHLARLAALHGCVFSQADLSSSIWSFILSDLSASYSNTPEGRRARQRDIKETKNRISRLIQNYQNKVIDYTNEVIEHNEVQNRISSPIAQFVLSQGGSTKGLKGLKANKRLLEYNNYLNHSDGNVIWHWIQSCFDN